MSQTGRAQVRLAKEPLDLRFCSRQAGGRRKRASAVQSPTRQSTRCAAAGGQRRVPHLGIVMRCGPLPWLGHGLRPGTLAQKAVLNVTPDGSEGGIWASDTGPAADPSGSVYVPTRNGTFDAALGGRDYSDSYSSYRSKARRLFARRARLLYAS